MKVVAKHPSHQVAGVKPEAGTKTEGRFSADSAKLSIRWQTRPPSFRLVISPPGARREYYLCLLRVASGQEKSENLLATNQSARSRTASHSLFADGRCIRNRHSLPFKYSKGPGLFERGW